MKRTIPALLTLAFLLFSLAPAKAQNNTQYFPETQHNVSGLFLDYWTNHGGLPQQGYPLTEPFQEKSDLNGQTYTVQYFERAVFEQHPENQAPYNVLLSQLGTFLYKQKYGATGAPGQQASTSADAQKFPQTGYTVGGKFLAYWTNHGGLAQQGYPISNEFSEKSDLNGQTYTVQYFERAVFEMHPENAAPYDVLLSQLGKFQLQNKYPNNSNPAAAPVGSPGIVPPQPTATFPAAQPSATMAPAQPTTTTAAPTATTAPAATSTPAPQGGSGNSTCTPPATTGYSACATISDSTPSRREEVSTYATLFNNNAPASGVAVRVIYHYKSTDSDPCDTMTGADGTSKCTINIGGASSGNEVPVEVTFSINGATVATASTSFTPK